MALRVCHISSELAPFAKTGGLADVVTALTRSLVAEGHDARVFLPMYGKVREGPWSFEPLPRLQDLPIDIGERSFHVSFSTVRLPDSEARAFLVRCPELFGGPDMYRGDDEDALRFALLSRAAIACCQYQQWSPDIMHCHDWHAGLVPLYLKALYDWDELFANTRTVLTIHNIGYQGVFSADKVDELGLGKVRSFLHQEDLDEGSLSFLKTGIMYAGALTTVSETYAREIQTPEFGMGLEELLRARSDHLVGIVNGVDYDVWDPRIDPHIAANYGPGDTAGKLECKRALMEQFDLSFDERAPVIGCVSRLTFQKGFELLPDALPVLLQREDLRLVVLGSGESKYEDYFTWLHRTYPNKVGFRKGYDDPLAHRIEAGSDLFLMPSRYEPCGLNQMYSLRYGAVPLVRRTGGLADTVEAHDAERDTGTGFLFDEFSSHELLGALSSALDLFRDAPAWQRLVERGMRRDFSWDRQAARYVEVYERLGREEL